MMSVVRLYVDGELALVLKTAPVPAPVVPAAGADGAATSMSLRLGDAGLAAGPADSTTPQPQRPGFCGRVAHVRAWARALGAADVAAHRLAGPRFEAAPMVEDPVAVALAASAAEAARVAQAAAEEAARIATEAALPDMPASSPVRLLSPSLILRQTVCKSFFLVCDLHVLHGLMQRSSTGAYSVDFTGVHDGAA
jgi:hypothetical protein